MRLVIGFAVMACSAAAQDLPRPLTDADFKPVDRAEAELGQLLFFDPILSGNRDVSCATCHHPALGTSDGLSLGMGDGGTGLGPDRVADPANRPEQRIPRNSPALFNLGAHEFTVLFHDGRIEVDPARPGGLRTPLADDMVTGFASLLSAQTMFPVLSADEMAGHYSENDVAQAVRRGTITGEGGAWDIIANRVADIPAYADSFIAVYDHIDRPDQIGFTDISNAVAAFMELEWRSDNAPFDAVLRGEATLPEPAATGMALFYGEAGCVSCHAGPFLTDHQFHAMGVPQIGPGKAERFESHASDLGRYRVTGDPADLYAFRTPSLRNVALTGPYGHSGAYADLRDFLTAHLDPVAALAAYDLELALLPDLPVDDTRGFADTAAIAAAVEVAPVTLDDGGLDALLAFLESLTDPNAKTGVLGVPDAVPSGLAVARMPEG
ncbi:cytochrome-c peroxidase [Yoonia vestfoldensis]|uniref:cytochrome-c peroxidase n=1 Tax=Yoonia vestfoldensis TaxID=245188 RepID=UPI00039D6F7A|nr:cytochrome c peroxidase [Yoonia vestfoldensis]